MSKPSLLIVEDEVDLRSIVIEVLESAGYTVIEARDGVAHGCPVKSEAGSKLLDLRMPRRSGRNFLQYLRVACISIPVIIVSDQLHSVREAVRLGAVDLIVKPFDMEDLLTRVAKYVPPHT